MIANFTQPKPRASFSFTLAPLFMHELLGKINQNLSNFHFALVRFYFLSFSLFPCNKIFDIFFVIREGFSDVLINKTQTGCAAKQNHKTQQNKGESVCCGGKVPEDLQQNAHNWSMNAYLSGDFMMIFSVPLAAYHLSTRH